MWGRHVSNTRAPQAGGPSWFPSHTQKLDLISIPSIVIKQKPLTTTMNIPEQNIDDATNLSNSRHGGPAGTPPSVNHEEVGGNDHGFSLEAKNTKSCPKSWWIITLATVSFLTLMGVVIGVIHNKSNNGKATISTVGNQDYHRRLHDDEFLPSLPIVCVLHLLWPP